MERSGRRWSPETEGLEATPAPLPPARPQSGALVWCAAPRAPRALPRLSGSGGCNLGAILRLTSWTP
eukprot:9204129-Alexandrium_andersonii.AAC.1